jgi:predicted Zn-dependent peptidase
VAKCMTCDAYADDWTHCEDCDAQFSQGETRLIARDEHAREMGRRLIQLDTEVEGAKRARRAIEASSQKEVAELKKALANSQSEASCWKEAFNTLKAQEAVLREDLSDSLHALIDAHQALDTVGAPGDDEQSLRERILAMRTPSMAT